MRGLSAWCASEQAQFVRERPGIVAGIRRASRMSVPVIAVLGLLLELAALADGHSGDLDRFAAAGSRLLRGDTDVFADPTLQVGPLYLLVVGIGWLVAGWTALPLWFGVTVLPAAASVGLALGVARLVDDRRSRTVREMLVGLAPFAGGALLISASYGHPEEALVGLLLIVATGAAWRGRPLAPALVLAAAVTIKLWAVVGAGLLLVAATRRVQLLRVAAFTAATAAAYLPFYVLGHVRTFAMAWEVEIPASLSLLLRDGSVFGYRQRVLQVVLTAAVGALVALRVRSAEVVWMLPVMVIATRLLLDPVPSPYYWSVLVLVVVLRVMALDRPLLECVVLAFAIDIAALLVITLAQGRWGAVALTALAVMSIFATARTAPSRVS